MGRVGGEGRRGDVRIVTLAILSEGAVESVRVPFFLPGSERENAQQEKRLSHGKRYLRKRVRQKSAGGQARRRDVRYCCRFRGGREAKKAETTRKNCFRDHWQNKPDNVNLSR
jgi:hypothetical protein